MVASTPINYEIDPHHGMGDVTWDIYQRLHDAFPTLRIAHEGVQYAATLGPGISTPSVVPVQVAGVTNATVIDRGAAQSLAVHN
jgi:hypothetical protein